jgi:hypothetical protein
MHSRALPTRSATYQALINLDGMLRTNGVTIWPDHSSAEFVKYLKGCFIAGKAELPLELQGRLAWGLSCHKVSTPKPG